MARPERSERPIPNSQSDISLKLLQKSKKSLNVKHIRYESVLHFGNQICLVTGHSKDSYWACSENQHSIRPEGHHAPSMLQPLNFLAKFLMISLRRLAMLNRAHVMTIALLGLILLSSNFALAKPI